MGLHCLLCHPSTIGTATLPQPGGTGPRWTLNPRYCSMEQTLGNSAPLGPLQGKAGAEVALPVCQECRLRWPWGRHSVTKPGSWQSCSGQGWGLSSRAKKAAASLPSKIPPSLPLCKSLYYDIHCDIKTDLLKNEKMQVKNK